MQKMQRALNACRGVVQSKAFHRSSSLLKAAYLLLYILQMTNWRVAVAALMALGLLLDGVL